MRNKLYLSTLAVLAMGLGLCHDRSCAQTTNPPATARRALLVGCTHYPHLPESNQLTGPGNDVILMRDVLKQRFQFTDDQITVLAEEAGDAMRPIRANIAKQFQRLAEQARPGQQIVILLAGHGSQQPDDDPDNPLDLEPDGMDEVFCPADVARIESTEGAVIPGAIVDDQLRSWLDGICAKGASVFIIFDSCHSGTATRGAEITRQIRPEQLLSQAVLNKARKRAVHQRGTARGSAPLEIKTDQGGLVAIYAALADQVTVERRVPYEDPGETYHGLLTYTLAKILTESNTPLTYAELVERIRRQYVAWGRYGPTPLVEGSDRHREVLGDRQWAARSRILLRRDGRNWRITGGSLHGLTKDSVLAVYPAAGEGKVDKPLGHVRVNQLQTFQSVVEPCEFAATQRNDQLPANGRCEPAYIAYGRTRLRVAFRESDRSGVTSVRDTTEVWEKQKQQFAQRAAQDNSLVTVVDDDSTADWLVWFDQGQLSLSPAAGWPVGRDQAATESYGPVPAGSEASGWLSDRLQRIARAKNLLRIASESHSLRYRGVGSSAVKIDVQLLRLPDQGDSPGQALDAKGEPIQLRDGEKIELRVVNQGRSAVDVTVLFVDSEFGVSAVFPLPETITDNRIPPRGEPYVDRFQIEGNTLGREHLVVLAVRGKGPPVDFSWLAQPSLAQVQSTRGTSNSLTSPLGCLLQDATFGTQQTRGMGRGQAEDVSLTVLSWETLPRS